MHEMSSETTGLSPVTFTKPICMLRGRNEKVLPESTFFRSYHVLFLLRVTSRPWLFMNLILCKDGTSLPDFIDETSFLSSGEEYGLSSTWLLTAIISSFSILFSFPSIDSRSSCKKLFRR